MIKILDSVRIQCLKKFQVNASTFFLILYIMILHSYCIINLSEND